VTLKVTDNQYDRLS